MYRIYIFSQPDMYDYGNRYELYDCKTGKLIIKAKTKYEFKLKLNLNGINKDNSKIDSYSIFENCGGSYTASIIMTKYGWLYNSF